MVAILQTEEFVKNCSVKKFSSHSTITLVAFRRGRA
jgi:hypothetical protein